MNSIVSYGMSAALFMAVPACSLVGQMSAQSTRDADNTSESVDSSDAGASADSRSSSDSGSQSDSGGVADAGLPLNSAPVVEAGPAQRVPISATVKLAGRATDDGRPEQATLSYRWEQTLGPSAELTKHTTPDAVVHVSSAGTYIFKLTVSDGELEASDEVSVTATDNSRPANHGSPLGVNLPNAVDYAGIWPFVDVMKSARPFEEVPEFGGDPSLMTSSDENGWPTRIPSGRKVTSVVLLASFLEHGERLVYGVPVGNYTVLYEGRGDFDLRGGEVVNSGPGQTTYRVSDRQTDLFFEILSTDPNDHLRNVRIIAPGGRCEEDQFDYCENDSSCQGRCIPFTENYATQRFHPTFLKDLRKFKVIRFMDWMWTNYLPWQSPCCQDFSDYPRDTFQTWGAWVRPMPVEVMVDLANALHADPWFNMPHHGSDQYFADFATAVRGRLNPELKVYVEYTNEAWNSSFGQGAYMAHHGCRRFSPNPTAECADANGVVCPTEVAPDDGCTPGQWCETGRPLDAPGLCGPQWCDKAQTCVLYSERFFAQRTADAIRQWKDVFSDEPDRVIGVLGAQIGVTGEWDRLPRQLDHVYNGTDTVQSVVDAVAVAPYLGNNVQSVSQLDNVFATNQRCVNGFPSGSYTEITGTQEDRPNGEWGGPLLWAWRDAQNVRARGLDLVAYEGGTHYTCAGPNCATVWPAIRRLNDDDRRMKDMLMSLYEWWDIISDRKVFVHFHSHSSAIWGLANHQGQSRAEAPKLDAALSHIERVQAGWTSPQATASNTPGVCP